MKRKLIGIGAVVLVLALLLTLAPACGNGDEDVTPTPTGRTPTPGVTPGATPTPTGEVKTLKIGVMVPFSGPAAQWGIEIDQGVEWGADTVNAAGGIKVGADSYMVELIRCDNKFTGSETASCATKLVYDDDVHYVVGPIIMAPASNPIFTEGKCFSAIIANATGAWFGPDSPYTWVTLMDSNTWVDTFYKQMVRLHPDIETIALIAETSQNGDIYLEANRLASLNQGFEIVHTSRYTAASLDYYPALTQIVAKNPDALALCSGGIGDQDLILKQARELGFTGYIIGANHGTEKTTIEIAGVEATEGFMTNDPDYHSDLYPEKTLQLVAEYEQLFPGQPFNLTHYLGYSVVWFYKQAIERAGSIDPDEVMKVMDDPTWEYEWFGIPGAKLGGVETFGIRRVNPDEVAYSEVHDGQRVMLSREAGVVP